MRGLCLQLNGVTLYHGRTVSTRICCPHCVNGSLTWPVCPSARDTAQSRSIVGNMNFRKQSCRLRWGADHHALRHVRSQQRNPAFFVNYLYRTYPAQSFKIWRQERLVYVQ